MALRSPLTVQPYDYIADSNGRPLDKGMVYIGLRSQDPEFYQIPVYLDAEMTQLADQPLRTNDGFIEFAGSLKEIYASAEVYSIKVMDKQGRTVIYKDEMMRNNLTADAVTSLDAAIISIQQSAIAETNRLVEEAINNTVLDNGLINDTFVTVTSSNGSTARTLKDKLKDSTAPKDFNAIGDGITNDTAAFTALELGYTGRTIDLQGKTYLVEKIFNKNDYINGQLKIVSSGMTVAQGDFKRNYKTSATPINVRAGLKKARLVGDLIRSEGLGRFNVVQSTCIDNANGYWYTLSAHAELGAFVNRYTADTYIRRTAIDKSDYHAIFGHQGLTMEYRGNDGADRMWTSMGYEPAPIAGYENKTASYTVSFVYSTSDTGQVSDYEIWKTYDLPYNGSSSPCISVDGRFLITRIQQTDADGVWRNIRVWEMSTIRKMREKGDFDISKSHIAEWRYDPAKLGANPDEHIGLQAIACDGNYVYMLEGNNTVTPAIAYIYTFDLVGNFIDSASINNIAHAKAVELNTDGTGIYECEGIQVVPSSTGGLSLYIQFSIGIGGVRNCLVYELGGGVPLKLINDNEGLSSTLLMGNSQGDDIHFLSSRGFKVAAVNSTGGKSSNKLNIGFDGTVLIGEGVDTQNPYSVVGGGIGGQQNLSIGSSKGSTVNQIRSDNSVAPPRFQMVKSRATTNKGTVPLVKGDYLGFIDFVGDDGFSNWGATGGVVGARIEARAWGDITQNNIPTRLSFSNNAGDAATPVLRWLMEVDGALLPIGGMNIGDGLNKVNNLYLANAPIVSSDENIKQDFRKQIAKEKRAALEIKNSINLYRLKASVKDKGGAARWHTGVKAQEVINILESNGLDPFDYAFVCFDEWDAEPEIIDNGAVIHEAKLKGQQYAIRYDELAMFILSAL